MLRTENVFETLLLWVTVLLCFSSCRRDFLSRMPKVKKPQSLLKLQGQLGYKLLIWVALANLLACKSVSQAELRLPMQHHAKVLSRPLPHYWKSKVEIVVCEMASSGFLSIIGDRITLCEKGKEILLNALPLHDPQDLLIQKHWDHFVATVRRPIPQLPTELLLLVASQCDTINCLKAGRLVCKNWLAPMSEELHQRGMCKLSWSALRQLVKEFDKTQQHNYFIHFRNLSAHLPLCMRPIHNLLDISFTRLESLELSSFANSAEAIALVGNVEFQTLSHLSFRNLSGPVAAWVKLLQGVNPRKLKKLTCDLCIVYPLTPDDLPVVVPNRLEFDDLVLSLNYSGGLIRVLRYFSVTGVSSLLFTQNGVLGDELVEFINQQAQSLKLLAWHAFIESKHATIHTIQLVLNKHIDGLDIEFRAMHKLQHLSMHGTEFRPWVPLPVRLKAVSELMAHTPHLCELSLPLETTDGRECQSLDDALILLVEHKALQRITIYPSYHLDVMEPDTNALAGFLPKMWGVSSDKMRSCFASVIHNELIGRVTGVHSADVFGSPLGTAFIMN
ncbi:hypothetical protein D9758_016506 [Tetrapyrgos nigripes]|uniref:F-box domain-containing protein n=1 Tax=Tetrapyrgos nigripes TaxID=182062 RepID=A0A8H5CM21_9AGAR|nr:hypothetical protein D9758_016506 [Tetrapyrgos nigripes]